MRMRGYLLLLVSVALAVSLANGIHAEELPPLHITTPGLVEGPLLVNATGAFGVLVEADDVILEGITVSAGSIDGVRIIGNNVTLRNITVEGATGAGISVAGNHVHFENVRTHGPNGLLLDGTTGATGSIHATGYRGIHAVRASDIHLTGSAAGVSEGVVFEDSRQSSLTDFLTTGAQQGVWVLRSQDITLTGMDVRSPGNIGINFHDSYKGRLTDSAVDANGGTAGVFVLGATATTIDNVTVTNSGVNSIGIFHSQATIVQEAFVPSGHRGFHARDVQDLRLTRSTFQDLNENALVVEDSRGQIIVDNNTVGTADRGLWVISTDGALVADNDVYCARDVSFRIEASVGGIVRGNWIEGCDETHIGIHVIGGELTTLDNEFYNLRDNGIAVERATSGADAGDVVLQGDTMDNVGRGVHLTNVGDVTIFGLSINDTEDGIVIEYAQSATVTGSTFTNGKGRAIQIKHTPTAAVHGNTIENFGGGAFLDLDGSVRIGNVDAEELEADGTIVFTGTSVRASNFIRLDGTVDASATTLEAPKIRVQGGDLAFGSLEGTKIQAEGLHVRLTRVVADEADFKGIFINATDAFLTAQVLSLDADTIDITGAHIDASDLRLNGEVVDRSEVKLDKSKGKSKGASGEDGEDHDDDHGKHAICHKSGEHNAHTLYVSDSAKKAHMDHGDTEGECPQEKPGHGSKDAKGKDSDDKSKDKKSKKSDKEAEKGTDSDDKSKDKKSKKSDKEATKREDSDEDHDEHKESKSGKKSKDDK